MRYQKDEADPPACAVDRLYGHALKEGSDKSGEIGGIHVVRKVTL
jgi:hypothetical protein